MRVMPFEYQIAPFICRKIRKITNKNNEVAIIFNDRF